MPFNRHKPFDEPIPAEYFDVPVDVKAMLPKAAAGATKEALKKKLTSIGTSTLKLR